MGIVIQTQEGHEIGALRQDWDLRAQSPMGRFFIASHVGWDDPKAWERQARNDAALTLRGLTPEFLSSARVLEIGCGMGRLSCHVAPRVKDYLGIDISAAYLEEARRLESIHSNCEFLLSPGDTLPEEIGNREFDLIYAFAVFIHCPLPIIQTLVREAVDLLSADGILRFHLLADPSDPEGYEADAPIPDPPGAAERPLDPALQRLQETQDDVRSLVADAGLDHLVGASYQGQVFKHRDVLDQLMELCPDRHIEVLRLDPLFLNVQVA